MRLLSLSGMRNSLSIFVVLFSTLFVSGQSGLSEKIIVRLESGASQIVVTHSVESSTPANLYWDWDLQAWHDPNSVLHRELIHEQNVDLHFASDEEVGQLIPPYFQVNDVKRQDVISSDMLQNITSFEGQYAFNPPQWKLTDQGWSTTFFGMNRPFLRWYTTTDSAFRPANLNGYHSWDDNPTELIIQNPDQLNLVVPGLPGVQNGELISSSNARTFFAAPHFSELETMVNGKPVLWIFEDEFPLIAQSNAVDKAVNYLQGLYEYELPDDLNILILDDAGNLRSTQNILIVERSNDPKEMELDILQQLVELFFTNELKVNEYNHPWLSEGLAHYHRYDYQAINYPSSKLFGAYASTFAARFLDVDELEPTYLHTWLYLYMARQGLDQPISDSALSFAPFNREAVIKGKSSLMIGTLRGYVGERSFIRGTRRMTSEEQIAKGPLTPESFLANIAYYANRDVNWFLGDAYSTSKTVDYQLDDVDQCSYIVTAEVANNGDVAIPYSTLGYDTDDQEVLMEWHEGHLGVDTIQLHLEEYDLMTIDPNQTVPDLNNKNQWRRPSGLFQSVAPLRLQFYTGLDQANKTQIYWIPTLKFNAYDGVLAGVNFYNKTIMPKRWEYKFGPEYSTRTGQLTGTASLRYYRPYSSGWLHALEVGLYGRYFHYDEDLSYTRVSPGINFHIRKSHPRSTVQQTIKLRGVGVYRELREEDRSKPIEVTNARYEVIDLRYIREQQHILHPSLFEADIQFSERFSRLGVSYRQRYMLPNRQWLGVRAFAGAFLYNEQPAGQPFFSFGLSGTQDYLFDYSFIGRSDSSGIWSQQFFVSDGGFKTSTGVFSSTWMSTLSVNVPVWKGIGLFGDMGYSGLQDQFYWDYGVRLAIVPDFLEVYFPFQNSFQNHLTSPNYVSQVRFVLNINTTDIIQRLRRGWY